MSNAITKDPLFLYIADIIAGEVDREEGEYGQYFIKTPNNEQVFRVRLTGTIIKKYHSAGGESKQDYTVLSIDDGTGVIQVKSWGTEALELNEYEMGDEVDLIGKPRKDEIETYLIIEQLTKITNPMRILYLRAKKALRYNRKKFTVTIHIPHEEEEGLIEAKEKIFDLIAKSEDGIHLEELLEKSGLERNTVEQAIRELLDKGDIYEPHNLTYKII
ncbi:MAG: hypothetical protein ACTSYD_08375 [Candidatus Heimdallarchaeaceae archaeon]